MIDTFDNLVFLLSHLFVYSIKIPYFWLTYNQCNLKISDDIS
ncbi:Uncharacterised protein [uncultured Bacteroides sp.]|jgi:hypothetical protein|nr:Uncharacterised protein [uncultured Bacteroides sp.]